MSTEPRSRRAPGPRGFAALQASIDFLREPVGYLAGLAKWGDVVRTQAGPFVFHTLFAPRWIRHVLVEHADDYVKRGTIDDLEPVLGEGLLRSEGERWRSRRTALQPAFSRRVVAGLVDGMDAEALALVERWERTTANGAPVDAYASCTELALGIVASTLFQADLGQRVEVISRAVEDVARLSFQRARNVVKLPLGFPTPGNIAYRRAIGQLRETVRGLLAGRGAPPPVFAPLAELIDPQTHAPLEERDYVDEAMTLFLAGHETTASTLTWTFDHLARERELQERVRAELCAVFGEGLAARRGDARHLDADLLERLPLTDAVVSEALRLHPPAWILMRRAVKPDEIAGFDVPARSFITIPVQALHRHPRLWREPERFRPERFLEDEIDPFAFLPFGAGPRRCVGELFARMETRVALARVLGRFELTTSAPAPEAVALATLRPRTSVWLHVASLARAHA